MKNHSINEYQALIEYIETTAEFLDTTAQASANHAFNLGCMIGLFPVILIVIATLLLTNNNWVAAAIIGVLW